MVLNVLADYNYERIRINEDFERNSLFWINALAVIKELLSEEKKYVLSGSNVVNLTQAPNIIRNEYEREVAILHREASNVYDSKLHRALEEQLKLFKVMEHIRLQEERTIVFKEMTSAIESVGINISNAIDNLAGATLDAALVSKYDSGQVGYPLSARIL